MMGYTIWKVTLKATDVQDIEVPADAELLTAHEQWETVCIWCRCNPDNPLTKRRIAVCGTGHPAPEDGRYLGTAFLSGGALVLHVFERPSSAAPARRHGGPQGAGVEAERERCARIAESFQRGPDGFSVALDIAKAIRSAPLSSNQALSSQTRPQHSPQEK